MNLIFSKGKILNWSRIFILIFSLFGSQIAFAQTGQIPPSVIAARNASSSITQAEATISTLVQQDLPSSSSERVKRLRGLSETRSAIVSLSDQLERATSSVRSDIAQISAQLVSLKQAIEIEKTRLKDEFNQEEIDQYGLELEALLEYKDKISALENTKVGETPAELSKFNDSVAALADAISEDGRTTFSFEDEPSPIQLESIAESVNAHLSEDKSFLKSVNDRKEVIAAGIEEREGKISEFEFDLSVLDSTLAEVDSLRAKVGSQLVRLDNFGTLLLSAELDKAKYTSNATYVFGGLVGVVIIGFFAIAFSTPQIREVMFGGDRGIQFITLFSLVIAIILFGILGILEGKELSALLGGLSGYILGRGTNVAGTLKT